MSHPFFRLAPAVAFVCLTLVPAARAADSRAGTDLLAPPRVVTVTGGRTSVVQVVETPLVSRFPKVTLPPSKQWTFDDVTIDTQFDRARLNECTPLGKDEFTAIIRPENRPINNSPWFAFKISSASPKTVTVRLQVEGGSLRYRPKISTDGTRWITLPAEACARDTKTKQDILRLEIGPQPLWVAAQELVSTDEMEAWGRTLERLPFISRSEFGRSMMGHPLYKIDFTTTNTHPAYIVIIGRQHPPEVTGSLALMRFVEELAGDSALARSFRGEFGVLLVPMVNPDGVNQGHWRHNLGGVDLNRDWEKFAQPETTATRDEILALSKKGPIYFFLDFHSTFNDVFYTQRDEEPTKPANFNKSWIEAIEKRFPDYQVIRSASPTPTPNTSIFWTHHAFGIPAITYEIGDNTDRALLQQIAAGAAQEMMKLLLEAKKQGK